MVTISVPIDGFDAGIGIGLRVWVAFQEAPGKRRPGGAESGDRGEAARANERFRVASGERTSPG